MSDREQRGLRGRVKSCTEESTHPGMTDADGKAYPEVHSEYTTEYDTDGRIVATRSRNTAGSRSLHIRAHISTPAMSAWSDKHLCRGSRA